MTPGLQFAHPWTIKMQLLSEAVQNTANVGFDPAGGIQLTEEVTSEHTNESPY